MSMSFGNLGRRYLRLMLAVLVTCAVVLTPSAAAGASESSAFNESGSAQNADPYSPGRHMPTAGVALSCPGSGAVCYYDSQNFLNILFYDVPSTCSGTYTLDPYRNRIESIRNRTGCGVYLLYYCGTTRCYNEWMRPWSEDGTISPLNAIDLVRFN